MLNRATRPDRPARRPAEPGRRGRADLRRSRPDRHQPRATRPAGGACRVPGRRHPRGDQAGPARSIPTKRPRDRRRARRPVDQPEPGRVGLRPRRRIRTACGGRPPFDGAEPKVHPTPAPFDELRATDPDVARWWNDHTIRDYASVAKRIQHPTAGLLCFDIEIVGAFTIRPAPRRLHRPAGFAHRRRPAAPGRLGRPDYQACARPPVAVRHHARLDPASRLSPAGAVGAPSARW